MLKVESDYLYDILVQYSIAQKMAQGETFTSYIYILFPRHRIPLYNFFPAKISELLNHPILNPFTVRF